MHSPIFMMGGEAPLHDRSHHQLVHQSTRPLPEERALPPSKMNRERDSHGRQQAQEPVRHPHLPARLGEQLGRMLGTLIAQLQGCRRFPG